MSHAEEFHIIYAATPPSRNISNVNREQCLPSKMYSIERGKKKRVIYSGEI